MVPKSTGKNQRDCWSYMAHGQLVIWLTILDKPVSFCKRKIWLPGHAVLDSFIQMALRSLKHTADGVLKPEDVSRVSSLAILGMGVFIWKAAINYTSQRHQLPPSPQDVPQYLQKWDFFFDNFNYN